VLVKKIHAAIVFADAVQTSAGGFIADIEI
jgi:hypothetical protein